MKTKQWRSWAIPALLVGGALPDSASAMRQYAAKQQRFMQRDPIAAAGWSRAPSRQYSDGLNLHVCRRNSPFRMSDPQGTICECPERPSSMAEGGTFCCCTEAIICNWGVAAGPAHPGFSECIFQHEQHHASSGWCNKKSTPLIEGINFYPQTQEENECDAYGVELQCLDEQKGADCAWYTPNAVQCQQDYDCRIWQKCGAAITKCAAAGMAGPGSCGAQPSGCPSSPM
jgi:hypothetical protein